MSTSGSKSDNAVGTSKLSNIWSIVTTLAGSNMTPQVQLVVCPQQDNSNGFSCHLPPRTGVHQGFKLYTPGSFAKHVQGCDDTLPPPTETIKKWKDMSSLWADMLREKCPKNNFFVARDKIWAVK